MRRLYHHIATWECIPAGMYAGAECGVPLDEGRQRYADFLSDFWRFTHALDRVLREWPISCEQFLSNEHINRIAWLGQASMCIATGIPAKFRSGFMLLSPGEQDQANMLAGHYLERWVKKNRRKLNRPWKVRERVKPQRGVHAKVHWWTKWWEKRAYRLSIPDEVPAYVSEKQFAPSYKSVCIALLSNDVALTSLGFIPKPSPWYGVLKRIELSQRSTLAVGE